MTNPGRIWFRDNPWPNGHAIMEFAWSGRLDQTGDLWFDLHLETVDYDSEGPAAVDLEDDWHSTEVWCNFHSCTLSSTQWADDGSTGFSIANSKRPLTWARLATRQFVADVTQGGDEYDVDKHHAFLIYLIGHDGVANHKLSIRPTSQAGRFDLEWTGSIALAYSGHMDLSHQFRALMPNARFQGFVVDHPIGDADAWKLFRAACTDATNFDLVPHENGSRAFQLRQ